MVIKRNGKQKRNDAIHGWETGRIVNVGDRDTMNLPEAVLYSAKYAIQVVNTVTAHSSNTYLYNTSLKLDCTSSYCSARLASLVAGHNSLVLQTWFSANHLFDLII